MARGDYFTFYYISDATGTGRAAVSLSVHNHRRISTFDMAAMEKEDRTRNRPHRGRGGGGGGGDHGGDDEEEEDEAAAHSKTGVNPFFVPQPHSRPVLQKDVFIWVEFPNAVVEKYKPDYISNTSKGEYFRHTHTHRHPGTDDHHRAYFLSLH